MPHDKVGEIIDILTNRRESIKEFKSQLKLKEKI